MAIAPVLEKILLLGISCVNSSWSTKGVWPTFPKYLLEPLPLRLLHPSGCVQGRLFGGVAKVGQPAMVGSAINLKAMYLRVYFSFPWVEPILLLTALGQPPTNSARKK